MNIWTRIINDCDSGRCAFNLFPKKDFFSLPIAHGEGRFVIPEDLLEILVKNQQTVFRYCDGQGRILPEYPVNPNGAVYNLAGLCNNQGNVLALMPHPERTPAGRVIFDSMKLYLDGDRRFTCVKPMSSDAVAGPAVRPQDAGILRDYPRGADSVEMLVDLIITDNEAQTLEAALNGMGIEAKVRRWTHWEIFTEDRSPDFMDSLVKSGELLNTNKEIVHIDDPSCLKGEAFRILVRDKDDFTGESRKQTLSGRLGFDSVRDVKKGVLWEIRCGAEDWEKILKSGVLFNPYSQEAYRYGSQKPGTQTGNQLSPAAKSSFCAKDYKKIIFENLHNVITGTDFRDLGQKKIGKVRDCYISEDKIVLISTDRQSAFDRILASIPFKGQVLNQVSAWWFRKTKHIIPNYLLDVPDPNVVVG
ncbi:MAG: phosphoribosylformylglycinamidine synthase subunit PurQ, partial [Thermodesulfobacteriota bacterium]